jgi:hypothetical protein
MRRFPPLGSLSLSSGGMIAPILGGRLLMIDVSIPVYTSVITFIIAGFCVVLIREPDKKEDSEGGRMVLH